MKYNYGEFNIIEYKIPEFLCELGSNILCKFFEWLDDDICNNRNKDIYRYKEKRKRTINTAFGSVAYKRRYYSERVAINKTRSVFLLDEILDIGLLGKSTFKRVVNLAKESLSESFRAEIYDTDYIKTKILNGDGSEWISKEVEMDEMVQYQLDLFHIYEEATRKIHNLDDRKKTKKLISDKNSINQ